MRYRAGRGTAFRVGGRILQRSAGGRGEIAP